MAEAGAAEAWTQEANAYPNAPQNCTNVSPYICVRWPKTSTNLSVTVYVGLDSTLGQANIDLAADARNPVVPDWNGIAARNPHLVTCVCPYYDILVHRETLPFGTYSDFRGTQTAGAPAFFTSGDIRMSSRVTWNRSSTCADATHCDSRFAMSHEMGHAEGLGHTGFAAIMNCCSFAHPQQNDKAGIIAIYGAYP